MVAMRMAALCECVTWWAVPAAYDPTTHTEVGSASGRVAIALRSCARCAGTGGVPLRLVRSEAAPR